MTTRRFLLCSTPAQGHTAPLLAVARRLVEGGHHVTFFTTEHYRHRVNRTGALFAPFATDCDAHDLMVANPEREVSSARGVRGVKDDLRRIFVGPLAGQYAGLMGILEAFPADVIVTDTMFFGALPLALGPRAARPALATIGVMPLAISSRDTAPFGVAMQPGTGAFSRLRNRALNWATEHVVLRDIQQLAHRRLAECGAPRFPRLLHRPATQGGGRLPPGDGAGIRVPAAPTFRCPSASSVPSWRHRRPPSTHQAGGMSSGTVDPSSM